jgi:hypothetical protein
MNDLPAAALAVLRSHPEVWFCVSCLASAGNMVPRDCEPLASFARSFVDGDDPKADEHGECDRCRAVGLVVRAQDRRKRLKPLRSVAPLGPV